MASHVRRFSRFGADAPHHFGALRPGPRRPFPAHGAPWTVRGRWPLQERGSIGSQYHCSKILSPLATKPRRARLSGLARQNDPVKNRPASELPAPLASCPRDPGCAAPFSSRIPTGARTDSGEERKFEILCMTAKRPVPLAGARLLDGERARHGGDDRGEPRTHLILGGPPCCPSTRLHRAVA